MTEIKPRKSWLDNVEFSHSKSPGTRFQYDRNLTRFCEFTGKSDDDIFQDYHNMDEKDFKILYAKYLKSLISDLNSQGYAPNTINTVVTSVKSFFKYSDLPLGFVPIGRCTVIFHNRDITHEEVQKILAASKPRDKAFYAMMAQSGLRPQTLCNLKFKQIETEFSQNIIPCKIDVPATITKGQYRSYHSFMGEESVRYLRSYFESERPNISSEDFLFTLHSTGKTQKKSNAKSFSAIFAKTLRSLQKSGVLKFEIRPDGKPSELRLYNLRKFFRKYAHQAGFEYVQFWMGHSVSAGVDEHYRPIDTEYYRKLYKEKAMPFLRLENPIPTQTDKALALQSKELEKLKRQNRDLRRGIKNLHIKLNGYKNPSQETLRIAEARADLTYGQLQHIKKILRKIIEGKEPTPDELADLYED